MRLLFLGILLVVASTRMAAAPLDLDREIILTPPAGHELEDEAIARWQKRADAASASVSDFERLGWSYVAKARRTLDSGYFDLALRTAKVMDARFGASDGAALLRGHALHNLHRFREAEAVARTLTAKRSDAEDFALLSDPLMEEGRVDEAVVALQRAADLKPGAEVDTRIAHLRWLKGDDTGAVAAMTQAVRETSPLDHEPVAWMLSQLAGLELERGDVGRAGALADAANSHVAEYPPALLAQGRVALARGEPKLALEKLRRAAELNPLPDYQWWLADALQATGARDQAVATADEIASAGAQTDPRTTALFLATSRRDPRRAVELCQAELDVRADIHTRDALAWALFAAGDLKLAVEQSRMAVALGCADPRLRVHAAIIALANGEKARARTLLESCTSLALRPSERALYHDAMAKLGAATASGAPAIPATVCRR